MRNRNKDPLKPVVPVNDPVFIGSYKNRQDIKYTNNSEYAFTGRSNAGKSSLINMLTGRKNLALTSSKPGKTRMLNLFVIDSRWNILDLPGYGYAKTAKSLQLEWLSFMEDYLKYRKNLLYTFLLVDASIPVQEKDLRIARWMGENTVPFTIVFTKVDKDKKQDPGIIISNFKKELKSDWAELPPFFETSAKTGKGKQEVLEFIAYWNDQWKMLLKSGI